MAKTVFDVDAQRVRDAPAMISVGFCRAQAFHGSVSSASMFVKGHSLDHLNHLPIRFRDMPWVRWPPSARLIPIDGLSARCSSAKGTPTGWPCEPEFGGNVGVLGAEQRLQRFSMAS